MDKVTRMLSLYSKLVQGEKVNKTVFCFENDCSLRSFDRDIEDIRLYLSEVFSVTELKYDRLENVYFIEGAGRPELEYVEYLFLDRVLKDTSALREDEFRGLLSHLYLNTEKHGNRTVPAKEEYLSPSHNKALLKIHGDMVSAINAKKCIRIKYSKADGKEVEKDIIPCCVKYDLGYLYMIGFRADGHDRYPAYYRLDRIYSFAIVRNQLDTEQQKVQDYIKNYSKGITQMYGGKYVEVTLKCNEKYYPYLYDKFHNLEITETSGNNIEVRIKVFEEGFVKWMSSQPVDQITITAPQSTKNKLLEIAREITEKYGGVQ